MSLEWFLINSYRFPSRFPENYGGDPNRIILAGQSAGGHLASVVLLQKSLDILRTGRCSGFQPKQLAGFCSISAPSDVQAMATNFQKHGLDQFFVQSLFGVRGNRTVRMDDYDPQRLVEELERIVGKEHGDFDVDSTEPLTTQLNQILPPMSIFHGTGDQTVSLDSRHLTRFPCYQRATHSRMLNYFSLLGSL